MSFTGILIVKPTLDGGAGSGPPKGGNPKKNRRGETRRKKLEPDFSKRGKDRRGTGERAPKSETEKRVSKIRKALKKQGGG